MLDKTEVGSLRTAFDALACKVDGDRRRTVVTARPNVQEVADVWRTAWNGLSPHLQGQARSEWKHQNEQWNLLKQWPCGLRPPEALKAGRLLEQTESIVKAEGPSGASDDAHRLAIQSIQDIGLDMTSNLVHFGPWRTLFEPSVFIDGVVATTVSALFLAVRLPGLSYGWARQLR
jgi:hypothetical protein